MVGGRLLPRLDDEVAEEGSAGQRLDGAELPGDPAAIERRGEALRIGRLLPEPGALLPFRGRLGEPLGSLGPGRDPASTDGPLKLADIPARPWLLGTVGDVDLFEINEAFAVVTMAAMRDLGLSHDKVNVHGGACALGHPIGASGTRIVVSLIYALQQYGKKRGVASLCIGGGEATALAIELI